MLTYLSIRDIVIIDALDLDFSSGLTVLTGETGAGKSILLDALGLALGSRADFGLMRSGTDTASVTASFDIDPAHPVIAFLAENDLTYTPTQPLIFRRQLLKSGKSSAYINDQPVSLQLLRQCGDSLVEIQGQFEGRGLLDISTHLDLVDRAGGHAADLAHLAQSWDALQQAEAELAQQIELQRRAREDEEWLRDAVRQLDELAPEKGEDATLAAARDRHAHSARIAEALQEALGYVTAEEGALTKTGRAQSALEKQSQLAGDLLTPAISALSRAHAELTEAEVQINEAGTSLDSDPERLALIEDRLHLLRSLARKHRVEPDALGPLHQELAQKLAGLDDGAGHLSRLTQARDDARTAYCAHAQALSEKRARAAAAIDEAVKSELPPLKLDNAAFHTSLTSYEPPRWSAKGWDRVRFEARTNPGMPMGPIDKIASGGELARFLLALKVVLSNNEPPKTLIFDEVDSGVGGAVAAAVGTRLARLGEVMQTLVITHSPQVAGKGMHHFKIMKTAAPPPHGHGVVSETIILDRDARIEEVARMLSADEVTSEARAAALNLLGYAD